MGYGSSSLTFKVHIQMDPGDRSTLVPTECSVMMVSRDDYGHPDVGLAILDTGCSETMHGRDWRCPFEDILKKYGVRTVAFNKSKRFRGVGGRVESRESVRLWGPVPTRQRHADCT